MFIDTKTLGLSTNNKHYLRDWQKKALRNLLNRSSKKIEVTSAYQGSGKTLYSGLLYIAQQLKDPKILDLSFEEIKDLYFATKQNKNNFAVIFIPANSIKHSTIKAWKLLGLNLTHKTNAQLRRCSLDNLMARGYNGLVCTYQQASFHGFVSNQVWEESPLISLLLQKDDVKIHAVLDECHELTTGNLKSKFILDNQTVFDTIHLMSGTLKKGGYKRLSTPSFDDGFQIPFVSYDRIFNAVPDTSYSQDDAIKDGVIVKTKIISHPIAEAQVKIDGADYHFKGSELDWFYNNFSPAAFKNPDHSNNEKLHRIAKAFLKVYKSKEVWVNLLLYGNDWLEKTRLVYSKAKGLIFAPSREAAILIHSELLPTNSVLCLGKGQKVDINGQLNYIASDKLSLWLEKNGDTIDWIISCEALKQGFDYADCKVQILVPQLHFLELVKISQMVGRTNRSITGYPDLEAVCLTLDYEPVRELLRYSQISNFGLSSQSGILDSHTEQICYEAQFKTESAEKGLPSLKETVKLTDLKMSSLNQILTTTGYRLFSYGSDTNKKIDEVYFMTYWTHWGSIVKRNRDYDDSSEVLLPPTDPGVYIIVNAKTTEVLYVGCASNLLQRISNRTRYTKLPWLVHEGAENLYIRWIALEKGYKEEEIKLKKELKPKYDGEKHTEY